MRAVVFEKGIPEELVIQEVPDPIPDAGEVLLRTKATALNYQEVVGTFNPPGNDWWRARVGKRILGSDVAGVVDGLGPKVSGVLPGDRVLVSPGLSCGQCLACYSGMENQCDHYGLIGRDVDGGYGELVRVPAGNLIPIPESLSFEEAASIPIGFVTAWGMVQKALLQPGEQVLVTAAGSGVGSATLQIAKLFNARVISTASTDEKRQRALQLGADAVVDYTKEGWTELVMQLTAGRGVNVLLDCVGGRILEEGLTTLVRGGRAVLSGYTGGAQITLTISALTTRSITLYFSRMGNRAALPEMMPFFATGQLRPVVHLAFPFSQLRQAHEMLLRREQFGKIVMTWD